MMVIGCIYLAFLGMMMVLILMNFFDGYCTFLSTLYFVGTDVFHYASAEEFVVVVGGVVYVLEASAVGEGTMRWKI